MKRVLLTFLFIINTVYLWAQLGISQINNFSSLNYKGGTQNWEIDQDKNGIMYFANNEGLLTYNGKYWKLYPLPNKTIVRSVKVAPDGKIFVGAQDEVGYFFPNEFGVLTFNSLKDLIPAADRKFADVWDIVMSKNEVYFRSTTKIFHLKDTIFNAYKSKGVWEFLGEANQRVFAQDTSKGLLSFKNGTWDLICNHPDLKNILITSILPFNGDTLLITTNKNGLYLLNGATLTKKKTINDNIFFNHRIYQAITINKDWYALATVSSGCLIINKEGEIIQQYNYDDGLQKNNLRSIFKDKHNNLWLGLDDGIDFIAFNNAIKYIYPDKLKQASGYATSILNSTLYVGTSNGVFASPIQSQIEDYSYSSKSFSEINGTQGQVWNLNIINNQLLIAHEDGAYTLNGNKAQQIFHYPGTWQFQAISSYSPTDQLVAGTYNGLHLISYQNNQFINKGVLANIEESLRFIVYDANANAVWASHPYRGIFKFQLNSSKTKIINKQLFTQKNGLPSTLGNYVAKIKNRVVVATLKGIYEYDSVKQQFSPSPTLFKVFEPTNYQYLKEDSYGNVWFVTNKKVGVIDFNRKEGKNNYNVVYFPELNAKVVAGFENIYPYNSKNIFIGANKGLIHINYEKYLENIKPLELNLTQVNLINQKDSLIFGGYFINEGKLSKTQNENQIPKISFQNNSLHFEYASTLYEQQNNIEYSYKLKDFDKSWSVWSSKSEKDYTNLPNGKYTFEVKARNNLGGESQTMRYCFIILPPWYQTWWFYILCFFTLCFIIYLIILRQKKKYLKEQEYLRKEHQLEKEHNENEIVKLQNEKLEADVNFKNKELATTTMHLMQRGKLLSKIKEELLPIVKTENIEESPEEFKKILSLINDAERADNDWEHFAIHFDHVHSNFLTKLKERIPTLTANDLKLCAYLKMNLSSKEIAQLMSVTIRAVEVSRYRLRKKLDVTSDTNLFNYLIEITS
ncbi:triple tyrosine motif-containing protein [Pedobacter alpinus]|uniref:Triple tyrosine motif-containing protein n=1 Tax=Pedobacter alpinus TaxID=1590643 RepID=A0ABW5TTG7_9SPHI